MEPSAYLARLSMKIQAQWLKTTHAHNVDMMKKRLQIIKELETSMYMLMVMQRMIMIEMLRSKTDTIAVMANISLSTQTINKSL